MLVLLQTNKKILSFDLNSRFINRSSVLSSSHNALVFPLHDQPYLGYSFYHIIKRFTGSGKKTAGEAATKIISENLPHSAKPVAPKTNLSNSATSSPVSKEKNIPSSKPITDSSSNKPQVSFVKTFNSATEKPEIIRNNTTTSNISSAERFKQLEREGIIQYGEKKHETHLSPEAREIYRAIQPKYKLKDTSEKNNNDETSQMKLKPQATYYTVVDNESKKETFVAGIVSVNEDNTEILTGVQHHLSIGYERDDGSTIIFGFLTSEKGTKIGIAGMTTTEKISDTQPLSGKAQGQYISSIIPAQIVAPGDFKIDASGTEFVNQTDVNTKLSDIASKALARLEPIKYNPTGITMDDLNIISDIKPIIDKKTTSTDTNLESNEEDN